MAFSYVEMMRNFGLSDFAQVPNFEPAPPAALTTPLTKARVGLFASCGALLPSHRPFEAQNDFTFRLIPREVPVSEVTFMHPTPVRGFAEQDLNVAYPRDRLLELEQADVIGELASHAVSMLGSITTYTALAQQTIPMIAETFRDMRVDVVLLIPFCPACHRATSVIARGLEARGLPTIMLTVLREMAEGFKPARPVFLDYPLGATAGRPNDPANQREILTATLVGGSTLADDWRILDLPFQFAADGSRAWENDVRDLYTLKGKDVHRARVAKHIEDGESLVGREIAFSISCAC
jgi:D-proline reductase (dithiol) PrdB